VLMRIRRCGKIFQKLRLHRRGLWRNRADERRRQRHQLQRGERQDERKRYPVHAASGQVSSVFTRVPGMVSASAGLIASGPAIRTAAIAALTSCILSHRPT